MSLHALRNIAIIAHVDHGKTTLVDFMLRQSGQFRDNEVLKDRVMDSGELERERGITILAKNTAVEYVADDGQRFKINIVDTPGHADFGGEVERVMKMVDGALLLVDASEGPLPQTRFVLGKALAEGHEILVCINKIDRPDARAEEVVNEVYDLFIDLGADDHQIDFPILFVCAKQGYAHTENRVEPGDLRPLFDAIVAKVPAPTGDPEAAVPQMLVTQLDYDNYLGRLTIGRVFEGTIRKGEQYALIGQHETHTVKVTQLFTYDGLKRIPVDTVPAGEIVAIAGIDVLNIGDTLTSITTPKALPRVHVEEPTIGVTFLANDGPFVGLDGKYVTMRKIRERLSKEILFNVALRVDLTQMDRARVFGRGELQLAILIEQMRREGFELCVSKPEVVIQEDEQGHKLEPYEMAELDFPTDFMGVVSEKLNLRKGRMVEMKMSGSDRTRVTFRVPSRGLIGFRGEYLNDTRGQGIMNTLFDQWDTFAGYIPYRQNGSLVADRTGQSTAYALYSLQERGKLFIGIQTDVYEGMIIGGNARTNDMNVNPTKPKQLNNIRSAGADEKLILTPPVQLTLEKAMEYIAEDELVEVTPKNIRLRKKALARNQRSVVRGERTMKK